MQQESETARSSGPQQGPALPDRLTMPPPESPSEGHQSSPSPTEQTMKEEFQFLCCQRCKVEAKCPKLLSCLHTLCSGCLETSGMECPICQVPRSGDANIPALDNIFFESLQRHLSLYRQIKNGRATCTRCREPADFWCFECEQFLCAKCFEAHQWYVKHEARPLADFHSQTVNEFLERMRKSNNIFCSNSRHHVPELTSIYCRGCSKPQCCSCALLDKDHSEDKCDISVEIKQRQEDLDAMTEALQEQECAFATARTQLHSVIRQLGKARANTEKLIQARVSEVVQQVQALENELLQSVEARYQSDNKEIIKLLEHLDTVLQRIRMGGMLVQKMKRYASDQEVLDMHSFLHEALCHLRQEEPQSLQVPVYTDSFEEFKEEFKKRLKGLVSSIAQETGSPAAPFREDMSPANFALAECGEVDETQPRRASPEAASTPTDALDTLDVVQPEEVQTTPEETLGLSETQPVTVAEQVPRGYPVPLFAFSINDPSYREEISNPLTPQKRKFCQTESPRKIIKTESEEEKEATLFQSPSDQPTPSTSTAVSPPHHDGPSSPRSPAIGDEVSLPNNNHMASEPGEAGNSSANTIHSPAQDTQMGPVSEERVVVISSSEDSDAENSSSQEMVDSSNESSDLQLEGANPLRVLDDSISNFPAEDSPLVFFDLKIDNETQKISQLAAVNQESKFRVLIQPEAFSIYSKAVSLELGLRHFLRFLNSMRHPILACYKLWGPGLPNFFQALEDMNSLWEFQEAISGFLATLPLIQECVPGASSFKLKNLAKTYLARNMNERSALATVLTMRDLCHLFEIIPGPQLAQHVYSFSSLKCFASLQPLVCAAVLPRAEARLLALHNVSFLELMASHRRDPQGGLRKYCRYLSLQAAASPPTQPAFDLQALCAYFTDLLAQEEGISAPPSSHSLAKSASQQS